MQKQGNAAPAPQRGQARGRGRRGLTVGIPTFPASSGGPLLPALRLAGVSRAAEAEDGDGGGQGALRSAAA